ncbi:MAG TPA: tRNA pseudouridine(13) synthase TruD [Pseudohongiella sp.]|nr:tRNA pseudouridine(13) synthase TruD [Pseudohongiella sp.]
MLPVLHRTRPLLFAADFKQESADFCVDEELGFECSGEGEHVWVLVRKTGINTVEAARRLARAAAVDMRNVSWSGLKDKHGICRQWISLQMPDKETPSFEAALSDELQIEQIQRNHRKLRRGNHRSNRFVIRLRNLRWLDSSNTSDISAALEQQLQRISAEGVPNYFGEQRFGNDNISKVTAWFGQQYRPRNPVEKGLLLSAARSLIFNAVLSERVAIGNWNQYLSGDVMNLDGSGSVFVPEALDETLAQRLQQMDIHPTGPLWGRGDSRVTADVLELENRIVSGFAVLADGLVRHGVEAARRSLRLPVQALHYRLSDSRPDLELTFSLPAGSFATAVLHELIEYNTL